MKIPKVPVIIVRGNRPMAGRAMVIPETSMTVTLNDAFLACVVCRPENPEEVAAGLLLTQGLVDTPDRLKALRVHPSRSLVAVQTRPGADGKTGRPTPAAPAGSAPPFPPPKEETAGLVALAAAFLEEVQVKGIFGAYRVTALAHPKEGLLCRAADVDTPVAVDRLLGKAFLAGLELSRLVLLLSGRLRPDTVAKAARCGIRAVVGAEAVTRLALRRAREAGIRVAAVDRDGALTVFGPEEDGAAGAEGVAGRG